jgi:hypothetical protein
VLDAIKDGIERVMVRFEAPWNEQAASRDRARPLQSGHWFLAEELRLVSALAAVILPSDDRGPGATEAKIAQQLDVMLVAAPQQKQRDYARGLLSFDEWARRQHGRAVADLSYENQVALVTTIAAVNSAELASPSLLVKIRRKLTVLNQRRLGLFPAVPFLPLLIRDVMRLFYTSKTAWDWLGYDGPPMPKGYDDLMNTRVSQNKQ